MRHYNILLGTFLILQLIVSETKAAAAPDLRFNPQITELPAVGPGYPGAAGDHQFDEIYTSYNNLARNFIDRPDENFQNNFIAAATNISALSSNVYASPVGGGIPQYTHIRTLLRDVHNRVVNFLNQIPPPAVGGVAPAYTPEMTEITADVLFDLFNNLLNQIRIRYNLAIIEEDHAAVAARRAFLGNEVFAVAAAVGFGVPNSVGAHGINLFKNTLKKLSGRIFVVKGGKSIGEDSIATVSSGLLIPDSASASPTASRVLTCIHCIQIGENQGPSIEVYFVRSEAIDLETGLPPRTRVDGVVGLGGGAVTYNESQLIEYLRRSSQNPTNQHVKRVETFVPLNHSSEFDIRHHLSNYDGIQEDAGFGVLKTPFIFNGENFATLDIVRGNVIPPNPDTRYYALGYPIFSHRELVAYMPTFSTAPLTLTTRRVDDEVGLAPDNYNLRVRNNILEHACPVSNGMSGGPIFYFIPAENKINVIGIIQGYGNLSEYFGSLV